MGSPVSGMTGSAGIVVEVVVDASVVADGSVVEVLVVVAISVVVVASTAVVVGADPPSPPHADSASTRATNVATVVLGFTLVLLPSGRKHFQLVGSRERAFAAVGQFEPCCAGRQQDGSSRGIGERDRIKAAIS